MPLACHSKDDIGITRKKQKMALEKVCEQTQTSSGEKAGLLGEDKGTERASCEMTGENIDDALRGGSRRSRRKTTTRRKQNRGNYVSRGVIAENSRRFRSCSRRSSVVAVGFTSRIALALQEPDVRKSGKQTRMDADAESEGDTDTSDVDVADDASCELVDHGKGCFPHSFLDAASSDETRGAGRGPPAVHIAAACCSPSPPTNSAGQAASASQPTTDAGASDAQRSAANAQGTTQSAKGASAAPLPSAARVEQQPVPQSAEEKAASEAMANTEESGALPLGPAAEATEQKIKEKDEDGWCAPPNYTVSEHTSGRDEYYDRDELTDDEKWSIAMIGGNHFDEYGWGPASPVLSTCVNFNPGVNYEALKCNQVFQGATEATNCEDKPLKANVNALVVTDPHRGPTQFQRFVWKKQEQPGEMFWRVGGACNTGASTETGRARVHETAVTDPEHFFEGLGSRPGVSVEAFERGICVEDGDKSKTPACKMAKCVPLCKPPQEILKTDVEKGDSRIMCVNIRHSYVPRGLSDWTDGGIKTLSESHKPGNVWLMGDDVVQEVGNRRGKCVPKLEKETIKKTDPTTREQVEETRTCMTMSFVEETPGSAGANGQSTPAAAGPSSSTREQAPSRSPSAGGDGGDCETPGTVVSQHAGEKDQFYYLDGEFESLSKGWKAAIATKSGPGLDYLNTVFKVDPSPVLSGEFGCVDLGKYEFKKCEDMGSDSQKSPHLDGCFDDGKGFHATSDGFSFSRFVWAKPEQSTNGNADFWRKDGAPCNANTDMKTSVGVHRIPLVAKEPDNFFEEKEAKDKMGAGIIARGVCNRVVVQDTMTKGHCTKSICHRVLPFCEPPLVVFTVSGHGQLGLTSAEVTVEWNGSLRRNEYQLRDPVGANALQDLLTNEAALKDRVEKYSSLEKCLKIPGERYFSQPGLNNLDSAKIEGIVRRHSGQFFDDVWRQGDVSFTRDGTEIKGKCAFQERRETVMKNINGDMWEPKMTAENVAETRKCRVTTFQTTSDRSSGEGP
ncbi:unnamed protein product [Amoebophrya sp. A25]|nr:unnamed protein product [Amoebophrya sp. A25]|eukprot:GSA25T00023895001.1